MLSVLLCSWLYVECAVSVPYANALYTVYLNIQR